MLADSGLVRVTRAGQRRLYVVDPEGFETLRGFLNDLWPSSLARLKDVVEAADSTGAATARPDGA